MDRSFGLDYDPRQFPNEVYYNEVIDNFGKMIHTQKAVVIGLCYSMLFYFYSASSSPQLLRGIPDYSIDTVLELTCQSATGNYE